ncbi:MAG: sugar transferase [Planctomycetota bacterium]
MSTLAADISRRDPEAGASRPAPTVWGLDARGLHDHYWAAHGVKVVRRGVGSGAGTEAGTYLLLEPHELALFDLTRAASRLPRRRSGALGVRVIEPDAEHYSERVVADESSRLIALRRRYASRIRSELEVLLTRDPALASLWHSSPDHQAGRRAVRLAAGLHGHRRTSCYGRSFDAASPGRARACILTLAARWRGIDRACPGVTARQPGVWVHDSATVEPGVRFVPPVWIGAGATLRSGDIVVGPWIVDDEVEVDPPRLCVTGLPLRAPYKRADEPPKITHRRRVGKRLFDIVFSLAALILTAPLFPLIMLAIRLEDGRPFFFAPTRQTRGGKDFACYKFRTMCKDADRLKARLATRNICDGPQFHIEDDPRLLRVGAFLRRFHLDELPQLINVLLGQMSIVGPRPSPHDENQFCPAWREARLSIKPGLTGLWQVSRTRAPNTDFQEWIRHDLDYVEHQSWSRDLLIICKTPACILQRIRRGDNGVHLANHGPKTNGQAGGVDPAHAPLAADFHLAPEPPPNGSALGPGAGTRPGRRAAA